MVDLFIWNLSAIIIFAFMGVLFWMVGLSKEMQKYIKDPIMLGLAATCMAWFEVGLFFLISTLLFLMFRWVIVSWLKQEKKEA